MSLQRDIERSLSNNPEFVVNVPLPTAQYAEPLVRNVPRPAVAAVRDPVVDYASATIGDFWRDGVREASYSGIDRQFSAAFDGLQANPVEALPRAVPGQQMSDALYLPGPFPISRQDFGIASLTVNSTLNLATSAVNAFANAIGGLTEPVDRFQGELISLESAFPGGVLAAGPTVLLARLSSAIRTERALSLAQMADRYGDLTQRQALLTQVSEAGSLSEAKGIIYAFREMKTLGYRLEDVSLKYRGSQGVDLVFSKQGQYAITEAKHSGSLSRVERYIQDGDGTQTALANRLLDQAYSGQLESFATLYRSRTTYELPIGWPTVTAIKR